MHVSEYISFAASSELRSLAIGEIGDVSGDSDAPDPSKMQAANRILLTSYLNMALLELYKKFSLLQKEIVFDLDCQDPAKLYDLPIDFLFGIFAQFENGQEIPLNNDRRLIDPSTKIDYCVSMLFPVPFKALIKGVDPNDQTKVSLVYAAAPIVVSKLTDFIDIPSVYTEAIINYMAYKGFASVKGDMQATNNTFYMRFIESCNSIRINGLVNSDNLDSNIKLNQRGFI